MPDHAPDVGDGGFFWSLHGDVGAGMLIERRGECDG